MPRSANDDGSRDPLIDEGSNFRGYGSHNPASSSDLAQPEASSRGHNETEDAPGTQQRVGDCTERDTASTTTTGQQPRQNGVHMDKSLGAASGNYEEVTIDTDVGTPSFGPAARHEVEASTSRGQLRQDDHSGWGQRAAQGTTVERTEGEGRCQGYDHAHDSASLTLEGYSGLNLNGDQTRMQRRSHAYNNYHHV